jgi:hypothetical protein
MRPDGTFMQKQMMEQGGPNGGGLMSMLNLALKTRREKQKKTAWLWNNSMCSAGDNSKTKPSDE